MVPEPAAAPPLARDLAGFLTAFAAALQRAQMYPEGHPTLDRAVDQMLRFLAPMLAERQAATFAVAPSQLFVGAAASDAEHPLLREMAGRLFRRNVGSIRLARGITREETVAALVVLTRDGSDLLPHRSSHVEVEPLDFAGLTLDPLEHDPAEGSGMSGAAIWSALARAMLGESAGPDGGPAPDPENVALAFDALPVTPARDGAVIQYLHDAADASRDRTSPQAQQVRRQVNRLLERLRPETVERLLRRDLDEAGGHRLVHDLARLVSATGTLGMLRAAAVIEAREISPPLDRLISKLARHAEHGPAASRHLAEDQLFAVVGDLLASWGSPGGALIEPLDHLPPPLVPGLSGAEAYRSDPMRLVTMQLDMGSLDEAAHRAVGVLVSRGSVRPLVELLRRLPADDALGGSYRPLVVTTETLAALLSAATVEVETVELLAPELGAAAIPLLLDALAGSGERSVRRRLLQLLAHFGNEVVPEVTRRLPDGPWYFQRNLLRLLQMLPDPPEESLAVEYSRHPDARVRVEGFRLLMRHPQARARGIVEGLSDPDISGVRVAVMAAGEDCPAAAAPLLLRGLQERRIEPGLVPSAIRALGPMVEIPEVVDVLLSHGGRKLPLVGWRVAAKSKESLAALSAMARHWGDNPRCAPLLARARRHPDPEIREAVRA
jgi:hypothetical protein